MCYTRIHERTKGVYMKNRKVFTLLLTGMLTLSMGSTVYASGTDAAIAEAQAEKQAAQEGLAQVQNSIGSLESKKQELESYLNSQYEDLTISISELSIQAAEKEDELNKVKTELEKAKKASADQYESMKLRIAYMYENAGTSALETLLSSESLAEFLNRAENAIQISTYDRNMLDKYVSLQKNIQENEKKVETESAEIDNLMTERASKQQEVQSMAASTSDDINSYVDQISASQEEAQQLMADISNADSSITALVQQAAAEKAAEEKAKAEAAAEAERQAAEAAAARRAAQQQQQNAGNQSNTTGSDTNASASGSGTGLTSSGLNPAHTTNVSGSDVVAFASQYVGYPYVYGGNRLTEGADCSYFVMACFGQYGISLPRNSYSMQSCGQAVSYDCAQPGDIICYPGHVAIYMGNGRIVHASSPTNGICYGSATYRPILTIRRVL